MSSLKVLSISALSLLLLTPSLQAKKRKQVRIADYPVADIIVDRWSPRAMSGELITDQELMSLFEAARWAPSSYNGQPWRFIYAKRDTQQWYSLFNLLIDFNKQWVDKAAVLIVVVSKNNFDFNDQYSITHSFDTGAACQNLALQANEMGLVAHGMSGFDYERAKRDLHVPEGYTVEAMFAIGKPGNKKNLPSYMQEQEVPSTRKAVREFIREGSFE
ncbi:MAG TPA: nitroreductase family protein [Candidatus Babeliales bacterium]|nr:nitroreductase family protein [Candidatus Babeliales bacterium]